MAPVWALRPSPDFLGLQVADSLERSEAHSVVEGTAVQSFQALLLADSQGGLRGSEVEAFVLEGLAVPDLGGHLLLLSLPRHLEEKAVLEVVVVARPTPQFPSLRRPGFLGAGWA